MFSHRMEAPEHEINAPGHRTYYWGQEYYNAQAGEIVCSMPLQQLSNPNTITTTIKTPLAANQTLLPNATTLTSDQLLSQLSSANDTNTECQSVVATNLTSPLTANQISSNDTTTLDQLLSEVWK
ncbi:hypothetical protein DdX_20067 [Ditylenchus destructor]|uniref:Uncharacterized protein n=1 Tax=Ditylenchus destructor TaxID=166010 RepID=A0AAD4QWR4_9BILA|nr:hypothetical protein DdX_20067 [Ditylenchus destructor]